MSATQGKTTILFPVRGGLQQCFWYRSRRLPRMPNGGHVEGGVGSFLTTNSHPVHREDKGSRVTVYSPSISPFAVVHDSSKGSLEGGGSV